MKIIPKTEVIRRLNEIYAKIPSVDCKHCQQCSNPIMWFKPEEINIREYLKQNQRAYITWSYEEFTRHQMRCPYLQNNRCSIYPVRPIVCRLQGTIADLPCPHNNRMLLFGNRYDSIIKELNELNKDIDGINEYFGTRKEINYNFITHQKKLIEPVPF